MLFSPSETVVAYGLATSSMRLRRTDASSPGAGLTPRSESRGGICAFYTQAGSLGAPPARRGAGRRRGARASGNGGRRREPLLRRAGSALVSLRGGGALRFRVRERCEVSLRRE